MIALFLYQLLIIDSALVLDNVLFPNDWAVPERPGEGR